jgi:transposase
MARKRTKLGISPAGLIELKERLRTTTDLREKERLQVVLWSTQGRHTLEDLAQLANRALFTIQIWLDHFEAGGMARVLERERPPGQSSPIG